MQSLPALPEDITAVVLPPSDGDGGSLVMPGGIGLLADALFYLGLLGASRALVPGTTIPGSGREGPGAAEVLAHPSMTPRQAVELAGRSGRFLLMDSSVMRRQDLSPLFSAPSREGSAAVIALSCSAGCGGLPVLTSPSGGILQSAGAGESTNSADSGLWLCSEGFHKLLPDGPLDAAGLIHALRGAGCGLAAEFCPGYTRRPNSPLTYLMACGEILEGRVIPWAGEVPGRDGILVEPDAEISDAASLNGFLWARESCSVGPWSTLCNCVLMPGSFVGEGCALRNAIVPEGCRVKSGTTAADRTPKVLGR
jgi:hypothetical protein